ncbi:MAG TPA: GDP-mannose 4,6-dehydratase, partial [Candidatus Absconditabacterales bacterium]|nr:GDP-mannose 4,6-dehydratase [Candidatus Absconditabacterales bacterium]
SPKSKICYASSCLIYGGSDTQQQNEKTLPAPNSIYAITKLEGMHLGNRFAEKYNIQVINTILYNHESQFRSANFVSMKIIQGAIKISQGIQNTITLGDISTQVDRGYAGDYIEAMFGLLQSDKKGDYIVSSGSLHTIQDLIEIVFNYLGLDWKKHIIIDKNIIQRKKGLLYGDTIKIIKDINWKPKIGFNKMILEMTKKAKKYMK